MTNREIDALVAEKVMAWKKTYDDTRWWWSRENQYPILLEDWSPSTEISDAWQVVEKMKKSKHENSFNTIIEDNFYLTQITPEYICKAALKAVGVEIE